MRLADWRGGRAHARASRRRARARRAGRRLQPDGGAAAARTGRSARLSARARNEGERAHARAQSSCASRSADQHAESAATVRASRGGAWRARGSGGRVAVLFIDLDNFKTINDSLGHAFGDRVLQAVGERLRLNTLFSRSFSARLGGDEFTVVCEDVHRRRRRRAPLHRRARGVPALPVRAWSRLAHECERRRERLPGSCDRSGCAAARGGCSAVSRQGAWAQLLQPVRAGAAARPPPHASSSNNRCVAPWSAASSSSSISRRCASNRSRPITVEALLRWRQPDGEDRDAGGFPRCRGADRTDHRHQRLGAAHGDPGRRCVAERDRGRPPASQ